MPTLDQLTTPLTPDQVKSTLYSVLATLGINVTSWKPGHPVRTIIAGVSTLFSSYTYWSSNAIKSKFLTLARGPWLTATAKLDYGTERNEETFAESSVTLRNDGPNEYQFDPEDLVLEYKTVAADGLTPIKYTYQNTSPIVVTSGLPTPQSKTITIRCTTPGTAGGLFAGRAVSLVPAYEGLSVVVESPISGADTEADESLIIRSQSAASAMSACGPTDAYRYWATSVKVNGSPTCTRVQVVRGNPVRIYLGNASGGLGPTELALVTEKLHEKAVPPGVNVEIQPGVPVPIQVVYKVWCRSTTLTIDKIIGTINAEVARFLSDFPMGGNLAAVVDAAHPAGSRWLYFDSLKSVIETAIDRLDGVENPVFHAEVTTNYGTKDVPITPGHMPILDGAPTSSVAFKYPLNL